MILAYAVTAPTEIAVRAPLEVLRRPSLHCVYAHIEATPGTDPEDVVRFFQANQGLFAQADILEFRYPTALAGVPELKSFLAEHETHLASELRRLAGLAQIAVYLPRPATEAPARSGTEYLRGKRERRQAYDDRVDQIRKAAGGAIRDHLIQGDRLLLLVPRSEARPAMRSVQEAAGLEVVGPFPPSGFAKLLS